NNAYCQDNEISWLDWENADLELLDFVQRLASLRRKHPVFHRRRWFQGRPLHGAGVSDIAWFSPSGEEMSEADWRASFARCVGVFLNGASVNTSSAVPSSQGGSARGEPAGDGSFFLILNAF